MANKTPTKDLDVVYFVTAFAKNDLIYSVRSIAQNLEFNKLWIYGGKKTEIRPDEYVMIMNQIGATKWDRVRNMYRKVCENNAITEDFILFHDDFFVLKPTNYIKTEYRCTLLEHAEAIEKKYDKNQTNYTVLLRNADKTLKNADKTALSYELHKPFIFNRKKLLKILNDYPKSHCIRSIYANVYGIGGEKAKDVKIKEANYSNIQDVMNNWDFVSTSDGSFQNGNIGIYLRDKFNKKCRFEV